MTTSAKLGEALGRTDEADKSEESNTGGLGRPAEEVSTEDTVDEFAGGLSRSDDEVLTDSSVVIGSGFPEAVGLTGGGGLCRAGLCGLDC